MAHAPTLLIVALSARSLAVAARASGFLVATVDFWLDRDTRQAGRLGFRMAGNWRRGFRRSTLAPLVDRLAGAVEPVGIVTGTGFEDRPRLLDLLSAHHELLGNGAAVVRLVKRPETLAALCREQDIPHPPNAKIPPIAEGWVRKRVGGAGGAHVGSAGAVTGGCGWYWQRYVSGTQVSVLFLADGHEALILGCSAQWADPHPAAPFRYGGAVRPAPDSPYHPAIGDAVRRLAVGARLRGLNSADFLVSEDGFHMIDVNPRPGASLDVFTHAALMRCHVDACRGSLPAEIPRFAGASSARVVYAPAPIRVPPGFAWPSWSADRDGRTRIPAGEPFCTVRAEAADPATARTLVDDRARDILAQVAIG